MGKGDPMSEKASYFNEREHQICLVARMVEDARTYWGAGGGPPPEPPPPFDPIRTMVPSRASYRALQWGTMNTVGFHAQIGLMDYGILNTLQVDPYGNINSTALG